MATEVKRPVEGDYKWLAILGGLGLLGLGIGVGIWKLTEWLEQRERIKQELIQEYLTELEDLVNFQAALAEAGVVTPADQAILDSKTEAMAMKERIIESYSTHWLVDLVEGVTEAAQAMGIWLVLVPIGGYIVYQIVRWLFKHRPPGGPKPPTCPKCGLTFADEAALKEHIERDHTPNPNPAEILSAQAEFAQQPYWVQETIAAEAGIYARAHQAWDTLSPEEITALAYAIGFTVMVSIAAPELLPAAGWLLL
ncbi:MAG: hypothetical protein JRD89_17610 [Deltaproteobacteria bacterium]|nr:hypothetical protein [Deltaproteobacteria bacterium]